MLSLGTVVSENNVSCLAWCAERSCAPALPLRHAVLGRRVGGEGSPVCAGRFQLSWRCLYLGVCIVTKRRFRRFCPGFLHS